MKYDFVLLIYLEFAETKHCVNHFTTSSLCHGSGKV